MYVLKESQKEADDPLVHLDNRGSEDSVAISKNEQTLESSGLSSELSFHLSTMGGLACGLIATPFAVAAFPESADYLGFMVLAATVLPPVALAGWSFRTNTIGLVRSLGSKLKTLGLKRAVPAKSTTDSISVGSDKNSRYRG